VLDFLAGGRWLRELDMAVEEYVVDDDSDPEPDPELDESSRVVELEGILFLERVRSSRLLLRYSRSSLPKGEDGLKGVDWDGGNIDIKSCPVKPPGHEPGIISLTDGSLGIIKPCVRVNEDGVVKVDVSRVPI
jgi:hypothetical protein